MLVAGFEPCPGFRNADVDGTSRIGVPTVGVLLCEERAGGIASWWSEREVSVESTGMASDGEVTSGAGAYAVRVAAWPRTRSAWLGSWKETRRLSPIYIRGGGGPYCPLHAHHPASADDLAIFTDCPHRFDRIFETDFETIGNLRVWIWVCCLAELLEVFHRNAVFIWGVTKNDNVDVFSGLVRGGLGYLHRRRIKVGRLGKLSDRGFREERKRTDRALEV